MRTTVLALLLIATTATAGGKQDDDLPPPQAEVARNEPKVDPPAVPAFDLPAVEPGFHSPRELRVRGKLLLGTEIKVKGYVTWIYDCAAALAAGNPKATRAQIVASIDKDPSLCDQPRFSLGDARDTAREASLSVVDVPRTPTSAERKRAARPAAGAPVPPKLAVGDYVIVTGTWTTQSPRGERNTNGLMVYRSLERATPAAAAAAAPPPATTEPEVTIPKAPPRKPVDERTRTASINHLSACSKSFAARQYAATITECDAATRAWDGNHLAWYLSASAHMANSEWPEARAAVERAVALRPDQGMYQLYHGISLYEAEHARARTETAQQEHKKPEEVTVNPAALALDPARDALLRAIKLAPDLWRAHYYLGRVYRDLDDSRHAAEQFTETIKTHATYRFGYIALIELYRRWDYLDPALAVAMLGTANVPPGEVSELWYEAGMVYDAKHADDKAIDAFGKAIAARPDDAGSKFQRGQVYFRKGDLANARRDLEDVTRSSDPQIAPVKPIATQLLGQIARKQR